MIDSHYKIVTREIAKTASCAAHFIAELRDVYVLVNGERFAAQFPQKEFLGKTQKAAMIEASNAVQIWLKKQARKFSISHVNNVEQS